ncbi:helix-turn-helix transcriptional regulator [Shewanella colwelliana]|uniref:helix-turn-helix transcriptional regulator n=1 Tax=Shewanella colwelliana TaxID=23 RepID=UPI000563E82E|nr:AlpA family phage regulatory protein [Shewanella colwelliana]
MNSQTDNPLPYDRLVRESERKHITGISRTTAWSLERKGLFPKRRELIPGGSEVAWSLIELNNWIESRKVKNIGGNNADTNH